MNNLNVSFIIVNHNHGIKLEKLINSIYKKTNSIKFEIILINNTPYDNVVALIKKKYPKVLIFENQIQIGFSSNNNFAAKQCKGEKILILNPDIILKAARYVENKCDAIDINFGCPQGIAKKGKYGVSIYKNIYLPL